MWVAPPCRDGAHIATPLVLTVSVSAGCGTSRYTPVRFACPPEATLLTLVGREQE